jgi:hypothetical protein
MWIFKNEKVTAGLKNKTWSNLQIKNLNKNHECRLFRPRHNTKIQNT